MKILIMTRSAWDDSNSIGNTMSNIFYGYDSNKLANFYVRDAKPNNKVCNKYFSISDKDIIKSLISIKNNPGNSFVVNNESSDYSYINKQEEKIYNFFRKKPSDLALIGQEILWKTNTWKNRKLDKFLDEFQPDIIFSPSFHTNYTHRILWYMQEKTGAKVALFHADDYLTVSENGNFLKKNSEKKRFITVKRSILKADINYCISHKQQLEYQEKSGEKMKLLYKGADFSLEKPSYIKPQKNECIRIVYIGSILYGRWKTLALLAKTISKINEGTQKHFELNIYSQYEITKEMKQEITIDGSSIFMGEISPDEIKSVYVDADIVLHVESFDVIERQKTRLSFSTKIVDCLSSGRTVMAFGWKEAASIDYLISNDAALVAADEDSILQLLKKIEKNPNILEEYADKAWSCGEKNHEMSRIQTNLYNDFQTLMGNQ